MNWKNRQHVRGLIINVNGLALWCMGANWAFAQLRHSIQISFEACFACHPVRYTELLGGTVV